VSEVRRTLPFVVLFVTGVLIGAWVMVLPRVFQALGLVSGHLAQNVGAPTSRVGLTVVVLSALGLMVLPAVVIHGALHETSLKDLAPRDPGDRR
jgi:hypothetical protein